METCVDSTEEAGGQLVTRAALQQGDLVLTQQAVVVGPGRNHKPVCVVCLQVNRNSFSCLQMNTWCDPSELDLYV